MLAFVSHLFINLMHIVFCFQEKETCTDSDAGDNKRLLPGGKRSTGGTGEAKAGNELSMFFL